jgi:NAD(P)-dependent dehydrogenase (short-subunit alcohol dehydrogenase family)
MEQINSLFSVKEKVAIITGGGGIIGGALAKGFVGAGAKVILLGRTDAHLKNRVDALKTNENEIISFKCDVLDRERLKQVNKEILDKYGRIDVLINAAGGNMPGATIGVDQNIFDLDMDAFKEVTDLNLIGTVLPTLVFAKSMAENGRGSIINISSMASTRAITRVVGYSAAKAAVENFTKWMAVELARKFGSGVRINAIAPGFLLTNQNRRLLTNEDGSLTERGKSVISLTPFNRFGDPEEMIGPVIWLASDASAFVTGAIIPIDGGFSSFSGV